MLLVILAAWCFSLVLCCIEIAELHEFPSDSFSYFAVFSFCLFGWLLLV